MTPVSTKRLRQRAHRQAAVDQHRSDPAFMEMLRRKVEALRGKLTHA
jgi:hypothetical protein